jgi:hypothetical protein
LKYRDTLPGAAGDSGGDWNEYNPERSILFRYSEDEEQSGRIGLAPVHVPF